MDSDAFMVSAISLAWAVRASKRKSQSKWPLYSEAPPEVNSVLDWYDAEVLIANALRAERQLGLLDGLDLADAADAAN
jgi:hypothetical protein